MELKTTQKVETPEWIAEVVALLAPKISSTTQFVCKVENQNTFGISDEDAKLKLQISNSETVKTTGFETDGTYLDCSPINYKDGYVKSRVIQDWTWAIVKNVVKGTSKDATVTQTCYTRNKQLYLELRRKVGLKGY